MNTSDWIGFIGVTILLLAFLLNLLGKLQQNSLSYISMNIIGAGIACFASALIHYVPFIILEGSWALASVWGLISYLRKK